VAADPYTVRTCPACDTVQPEGVKLIKCIPCGVVFCWTCRLTRVYYHAVDCPNWRNEDEERADIYEAQQKQEVEKCKP